MWLWWLAAKITGPSRRSSRSSPWRRGRARAAIAGCMTNSVMASRAARATGLRAQSVS